MTDSPTTAELCRHGTVITSVRSATGAAGSAHARAVCSPRSGGWLRAEGFPHASAASVKAKAMSDNTTRPTYIYQAAGALIAAIATRLPEILAAFGVHH